MKTIEEPLVINGRRYPLWSQFVQNKSKWIGGVLEDRDMGMSMKTVITDVELRSNGDDSAFFEVHGEDFGCGFDVTYGGVTSGESGWITFSGYGGHEWRIKEPKKA